MLNTSTDYDSWTSKELATGMQKALTNISSNIYEYARMFVAASKRKDIDLTGLRGGIVELLPAIADGTILPLMAISLQGSPRILKALAGLSVAEQAKVLKRGCIPVLRNVKGEEKPKTVCVPLMELSLTDTERSIDQVSRKLISPERQKIPSNSKAHSFLTKTVIVTLSAAQYQILLDHCKLEHKSEAAVILACLEGTLFAD
jgi:hypothetical protein